MKALIQRVRQARVEVADEVVGSIDQGLLVLVGVEREDDRARADKLLHKLLRYRVFSDENGKMNRSLSDVSGGLLLVSQFTLAADTGSGLRPSFSTAALPALGEELYDYLVAQARLQHAKVACGRFGADMQVYLQNDGPVTFLLEA
ncbi:MAG TPA: D-tyrosyl-tRNA(Tyr) deacylase [Pseudomonas sp.]|jgi:D-tyrosyl-tRNA(Tyr) deacylase|uniref:D-aminoacyl-tRNA deacylase n=1 Tax=Stutzerimonas xanthomarina TaxID=271420 RepID=UPI000E9A0901|nr:D-aminoacyl-tRNA deacylase [Stutzerimonas xanthomarina]MBU0811627.1 D-tyrosyl-tRNA(Tyr) deacylase [Gammaproteobacteria bacterium]HAQ85957.1 D-tyrosyl-tRNA(Tyr) deacylase [Pseudomonas sp.]MBK3849882.1 D-tyrosyl-tRNA(Tyr) deacylase [Stutzerimonas xanthomarina]MBU0852074.1 D-tyrosyl-tRNA(Tyr) deacylase [Gammaproteobacteria bacterium]MBU1301747.1 D-tyrosyl-tRNA(Tyr) deacylase [Gammaproteobacteria bacterium]|tara:strand:+ start:874 stop:1311 length:438 start_codon:yes stop_codon:yes gene_type:complete